MAFVDFFGLDVERQVPGQVFLDRRRIIAEIAAVGFAIGHGVWIRDVGFVDGVKLLGAARATAAVVGSRHSAAALRNGRKSLLLRVILHVRQQGPWRKKGNYRLTD